MVEYDIYLWENKYREKIRKGYKDVTHLFSAQHDKTESWAAIEEQTVRELFHKTGFLC